jgi:hypothetical protein
VRLGLNPEMSALVILFITVVIGVVVANLSLCASEHLRAREMLLAFALQVEVGRVDLGSAAALPFPFGLDVTGCSVDQPAAP